MTPTGATATIAVTNESSVVHDSDVASWVNACQVQLTRDVLPIWGKALHLDHVQLGFIPKGQRPPAGAWLARILDTSDVAGALGYHTDQGMPETYVFAKTTLDDHLDPSVTLSHELVEMVVDPTTQVVQRYGLTVYAVEACDPVEADNLGYVVAGVRVSDFITPDWFGPRKAGVHYDYGQHLRGPRQLAPGGYALEWSIVHGWHQVFASAEMQTRPGTSGRSRFRVGDVRAIHSGFLLATED